MYTLDAMRGIAAICVALYHLTKFDVVIVPGGYLAVDFFFALSGVVIAMVYEPRLRSGSLSVGSFARQRLIRFWPLYAIGATLGLVCLANGLGLAEINGVSSLSFALPASAVFHSILALLMLPDPWSGGLLYPANPPAWSLFFEFLVNMVFAVWLVRASISRLAFVWAVSLLLFVAFIKYRSQFNQGFEWAALLGGGFRVTCSFVVGVIFVRWYGDRSPVVTWWAIVSPIMLVAAMVLHLTLTINVLIVAIGIPLIVWLAFRFELPESAKWICEKLGDVSYPLYAVHLPVLYLVDWFSHSAGFSPVVEIVIFAILAMAMSLALIPIDVRIRSFLSRTFRVRLSASPQAQ